MTLSIRRQLPSVDRLLNAPPLVEAALEMGAGLVTDAARDELASRRAALAAEADGSLDFDALVAATLQRARESITSGLRPVINATGVILHTNLGRAPLSRAAAAAMQNVNLAYSNLEFSLEAGERGSRHEHAEALLCRLTGAESAIAVNNNAAGLLLALSALAAGREVIISRGQLVEIGGGFRIPEVMRQSGARLVEVGTTNRTYLADFAGAITEDTVALLRVHASNFRISGFTESAGLDQMASLSRDRDLILLDDLGSGCLLDTRDYGLAAEPRPQDSLKAGAGLVLFSGDKLLGGPQAGIIVGRADLVARLKRHPLARAARLDKGSIAGLNATLLHYLKGDAEDKIPVWRMISMPLASIRRRARRWARIIGPGSRVVQTRSIIGGGSLPDEGLETSALAIKGTDNLSAEEIAALLRMASTPVVARIENGEVLLDPRTVDPGQDRLLLASLVTTLQR